MFETIFPEISSSLKKMIENNQKLMELREGQISTLTLAADNLQQAFNNGTLHTLKAASKPVDNVNKSRENI